MDWLMVFVILAIVGQFALIKFLQAKHARSAAVDLAKARADLLESAADRQNMPTLSRDFTIQAQQKGVGDAS